MRSLAALVAVCALAFGCGDGSRIGARSDAADAGADGVRSDVDATSDASDGPGDGGHDASDSTDTAEPDTEPDAADATDDSETTDAADASADLSEATETDLDTRPLPAIVWAPCDLMPGSGDLAAECASVEMPRIHGEPGRATFTVAVKRIPAAIVRGGIAPRPRARVWFLQGGPGGAGVDALAGSAHALPTLRPGFEYLTLDHRGVGGSERLACPAEASARAEGRILTEQEWEACGAALAEAFGGEGLRAFGTTQAARDLGRLIDAMDDVPNFVWGGSYGTFWAQRYMHLYPDQAAGVVLEGLSDSRVGFTHYDADMDAVGKAIFDHCADQPACAARFAGDPWSEYLALLDRVDAGHCPALNSDGASLGGFFASLAFYNDTLVYLPALLARLNRCWIFDIAAIGNLVDVFSSGSSRRTPPGRSDALFTTIALNEMWYAPGDAPPTEAIVEASAALHFTTRLQATLAERGRYWPRYRVGRSARETPPYDGPLLVLHGGLDPATPVTRAREVASAWTGPHQHYVEFPWAAHDVVTLNANTGPTACALGLYLAFLDDPMGPLDTSCVANHDVPFAEPPAALTQVLLGVSEACGPDEQWDLKNDRCGGLDPRV